MTAVGDFKFVVVGSGFFGAVYAERIATVLGEPVLVVERRDHVGGNSFSEVDDITGVEYHRYGSHLFHTSNKDVWDYVNTFTAFTNYRHRVLSRFEGKTYTMPINLMTLNRFYGTDLNPHEAKEFIARKIAADHILHPANLEEKAISLIGRELYEAFVKGYTAKQWETDPKLLPAEIISRLPVRLNYNDFYFNDIYEGLPVDGYGSVFQRMLGHRRIKVLTRCDFFDIRESLRSDARIIYTGPIDRFFGFCFGPLAWRTLDFEITRLNVDDFQGASVINYADIDVPYTRIHEFKHLHPERETVPGKTLIMKEFSRFASAKDEPYYPVNTNSEKETYLKYAKLASAEKDVIFGGRLGTYRYLDMHQAIGAALKSFERELMPSFVNA